MRLWVAAALLCALCCALARGSEDIVVGCGGFVKSDVEINYSLIEVGAAAGPGCLPGVPNAAARAAVTGGGGAAALHPDTLQPACHKPCPAGPWHGCCCVTALG